MSFLSRASVDFASLFGAMSRSQILTYSSNVMVLSTEYCDITTDAKGRVCKEIGAFVHWSQSKEDDEIFKVYRREYKKRFAWTKTGKLSPAALYAWGEKAREKRQSARRERSRRKTIRSG